MSYEMRALTIWQPWATLLITPTRHTPTGRPVYAKKYETRTWATDYRGALAIHAATKKPHECLRAIRSAAAMREICTALIPILYRGEPPAGIGWQDIAVDLERRLSQLPRRAIIGTAELTDCILITEEFRAKQKPQELALGNWTIGNYAWELKDRRSITPVTVNGAQGLWRWR